MRGDAAYAEPGGYESTTPARSRGNLMPRARPELQGIFNKWFAAPSAYCKQLSALLIQPLRAESL
jgi:hypothetical protein